MTRARETRVIGADEDVDGSARSVVSFRAFRLDMESLELTDAHGNAVPLPPKPSLALALLVGKAGSLVTREQLREHVWPNTVIEFDQGINTCIAHLRSVLEDDPEAPRFIETVPRRGYRFVAPVTPVESGTGGRTVSSTRGAAVLLTVAGLGLAAAVFSRTVPQNPTRLVVLQTEVTSKEAEDSLIATGLADELRLTMAAVDPLRLQVLGRVTSSQVSRTHSIAQMRSQLGVDWTVETNLRRDDESLRLTVGLVDAESEAIVWSSELPVPSDGSFQAQDWIADTVASSIATLTGVPSAARARTLPRAAQSPWLVARALAASDRGEDKERAFELVRSIVRIPTK